MQRRGPTQGAGLYKVTAGSGHPPGDVCGCRHGNASAGSGWEELKVGENLFLVGQRWMHELAVENAGALGVRGQQPYHKSNLELKVKGEPVGRTEAHES